MRDAQIIKSYGRRYVVRLPDETLIDATTRGKRVDYACGDFVDVTLINDHQAVIEGYLPRKSLLHRQDAFRTKVIAANVTQLIVVLAAVPTPSETLLQRALLAAEAAHIKVVILLNKADLPETEAWRAKLAFYEALGYPVFVLSALDDVEPIRPLMAGETNIFLGQSGMGKSTLTNALLKEDMARVGDISTALDSGKHTTTHAELFELAPDTYLIDSPGLQEFGLHHLEPTQLVYYFPDMVSLVGQCRFHNCSHRQEPGCAIKAAVDAGDVKPERLLFLQRVTSELLKDNR